MPLPARIRRTLLGAAALMAAAIGVVPAEAAFPGQNGKIVFKRGTDVWTMNSDTTGATRLTTGGGTFTPTWGPQATQIAFARGGDVWVMDADGSNQRNITAPLNSTDGAPSFSGDGTRIAFARAIPGGGGSRIWAINVDGTNPVQLTGLGANPSAGDLDPAWSPNGQEIAFTRLNNSSDIWTVDTFGGGNETEYVNSPQFTENHASWAPDGSAIAFTTNRQNGLGNDIYTQTGRGGSGTAVAANPADDNDPTWSPDGQRIAFTSNRGGANQIWSVGAGGLEDSPVNQSGASTTDTQADWGQLRFEPDPGGGALPPPERGESVNATPVKGTVLVKVAGSARAAGGGGFTSRFIPLEEATQLPIGSVFDTRRGTVRLTLAANSSGTKTQRGNFNGGRFQTRQGTRSALTELRMSGGNLGQCGTKVPRGGAAVAARRGRRLFGSARGRFRTRGRNSAATVRGTRWLTKDSCAGTLTVVRQGSVVVRDFTKRRNVVLKRGKRSRYLARAPGR